MDAAPVFTKTSEPASRKFTAQCPKSLLLVEARNNNKSCIA